jgi:hypothetical protein
VTIGGGELTEIHQHPHTTSRARGGFGDKCALVVPVVLLSCRLHSEEEHPGGGDCNSNARCAAVTECECDGCDEKCARHVEPVFGNRGIQADEITHRQPRRDKACKCHSCIRSAADRPARPQHKAECDQKSSECLSFTPARPAKGCLSITHRAGENIALHVERVRCDKQSGVFCERTGGEDRAHGPRCRFFRWRNWCAIRRASQSKITTQNNHRTGRPRQPCARIAARFGEQPHKP